jgi:hypothetical protein
MKLICKIILVYSRGRAGDDVWRFVGKLSDAQRSMLDDRFKWKVVIINQPPRNLYSLCSILVIAETSEHTD